VTGLLLDRGLPVRAMVRREDERAAALRALARGGRRRPSRIGDVYRVVNGVADLFRHVRIPWILEATVTMAAVARELGVNALVNMSR